MHSLCWAESQTLDIPTALGASDCQVQCQDEPRGSAGLFCTNIPVSESVEIQNQIYSSYCRMFASNG